MNLKSLISIVLLQLVCCNINYAQTNWVDENSEWYYSWSRVWTGAGYEKITFKDTITIENRACKLLESNIIFLNSQTMVLEELEGGTGTICQTGDTIWEYRGNEFYQLYNMDMEVGDTAHFMKGPKFLDIPPVVTEVGEMQIGQETLKYQNIGLFDGNSLFFEIKIVEKIGIISSSLPFFWNSGNPFVADWSEWSFRCYRNSTIPEYNMTNEACNSINGVILSIEELNEQQEIYPNPANDKIHLSNTDRIELVEIFDYNGKLLIQKRKNELANELSIASLSEGFYILLIHKEDQKVVPIKIIKTE